MNKIKVNDYQQVFDLIGKNWMLITAGEINNFNSMTASWGTFGVLWFKNIAVVFVRPTRYTFEFIESEDYLSLSFFEVPKYRKELNYFGKNSGRDIDKIKATNLNPFEISGVVSYKEANTIVKCKKLYFHDFKKDNFLDKELLKIYEDENYHRAYFCEIIEVYKD